jgi:HSP90 family molecular chaperone
MSDDGLYAVGKQISTIDVRISYRIIQLFSEGLYSSSNKAIEELVSNSFDAGANNVHVILSPDLLADGATIVVIDDGIGMDESALRQHWVIGVSEKRNADRQPVKGRPPIGKFGIGKLATYVLAFAHFEAGWTVLFDEH